MADVTLQYVLQSMVAAHFQMKIGIKSESYMLYYVVINVTRYFR